LRVGRRCVGYGEAAAGFDECWGRGGQDAARAKAQARDAQTAVAWSVSRLASANAAWQLAMATAGGITQQGAR